MDSTMSPKTEELHYSFVYIAHPTAVTGFSWRKTSKYMPRSVHMHIKVGTKNMPRSVHMHIKVGTKTCQS